jgi:hypothetical protein
MNKNLDRIRKGWHPYRDAHPIYWVLADLIVLKFIVILTIKRKIRKLWLIK